MLERKERSSHPFSYYIVHPWKWASEDQNKCPNLERKLVMSGKPGIIGDFILDDYEAPFTY